MNEGRRPVRVTAVGDLLLGDSPISVGFGLHSRYPGRALARAFERVGRVLKSSEVVIGNLECPLAHESSATSSWRREQMRGDPEYAAILKDVGFTALNVANNHALQHGRDGFDSTLSALAKVGIEAVGLRGHDGWCSAPVICSVESGAKIGMLGYCWRPRQYALSQHVPLAEGSCTEAVSDVRRLCPQCDAVVVSLHWGADFVARPLDTEVACARGLIDAGASLVVGHHPQVRRPVESYGQGVIAYSLGSFVADLVWLPQLREGAALEVELDGARARAGTVLGVRLNEDFQPEWISRSAPERPGSVRGVDSAESDALAEDMMQLQRRAAYRYAARNLRHYEATVFAELVATTMVNKLRNLVGAGRQRCK